MNGLTLAIVTPEGEKARLVCSLVTLFAIDNDKGEGGGSFGVMRGHMPVLAALEPSSPIEVTTDGGVLRFTVSGGFASVKDDTVTVITDKCDEL